MKPKRKGPYERLYMGHTMVPADDLTEHPCPLGLLEMFPAGGAGGLNS